MWLDPLPQMLGAYACCGRKKRPPDVEISGDGIE